MDFLFQTLIFVVIKTLKLAFVLLFLMGLSFLPLMRVQEGPLEPSLHTWNIKSGKDSELSESLGFLFRVIYLNTKQASGHFWLGVTTGTDVNDVSSCGGVWVRKQIGSFVSGATIQTPPTAKKD